MENLIKEISNNVDEDEIKLLLMEDTIIQHINDIKKKYFEKLKNGEIIEGLELVEIKKNRVWKDGAIKEIKEKKLIPDDMFETNLSISKVSKYISKEKMEEFTYIPKGDSKLFVKKG